jgi:uncharacterized protein YoxC
MHKDLETLCVALDNVALTIKKMSADERTFAEIYGWNIPHVSIADLAQMATALTTEVRSNNPELLESDEQILIATYAARLPFFVSNVLPQLMSGNAIHVIPSYMSMLEAIRSALAPYSGWQNVNKDAVPSQLARRLRILHASINSLSLDVADFEKKIQTINSAHDSIENLPSDLEELAEAQRHVKKMESDLMTVSTTINGYLEKSKENYDGIASKVIEVEKTVTAAAETHRISSSVGLGASFQERADALRQSIWFWTAALVISLIIGGCIAHYHYDSLVRTIQNATAGVGSVQILLAALSIGGAIWFAWLASKQIGYRFRLAEDYAFKAAVAKAYEGYRREAARIDEVLEAKLFVSLLTRVDEAPLRFVDHESHGSPFHEFINSPAFNKALETSKDFKDSFISIFKQKTATNGAEDMPAKLPPTP